MSSARKQVSSGWSGWSVKNVKSGGALFAQICPWNFMSLLASVITFTGSVTPAMWALMNYGIRRKRPNKCLNPSSNSIIIHGVPESTKSTDKRAEDHKNVKDILNNVLEIADVSIINLYRLGGKGQNRNLKPRLLLATLNSKDKQHEALANT